MVDDRKVCPRCGLPPPEPDSVGWSPGEVCLQNSTSRWKCDGLYLRRLEKTVRKHNLPLENL